MDDFVNPDIFVFYTKNFDNKLLTALNFMYKSFLIMLIDSNQFSRFEILEVGFRSGIYKRNTIHRNNFIDYSLEEFTEILSLKNSASSNELEELFLLPRGTFSINTKRKTAKHIPREWWPDRYRGKMHDGKRQIVRKYATLGISKGEEVSHIKFLQAIEFVDKGGYLTDHYRKVRSYKMEHPKSNVYIDGSLQQEIDDWVYFKTNNNEAKESQKTICCSATIKIQSQALKRFLIFLNYFLENQKDCVNGNLSLAFLACPKYIIEHISDNRKMAGKYNSSSEKIIKMVISMLQIERGWLWQREDLINNLPVELQDEINKRGGWRMHCTLAKEEIKNYYNNLIKKQMDISVNTKTRAQAILELDKPLSKVYYGLECWRKEILQRAEKTEDFARELQDYLLVFLMTNFPLRTKNWSLMRYNSFINQDNHLQISASQEWTIKIPKSELKNGYNSKDLRHVSHVTYPLSNDEFMQTDLKLLWLFIFEYRQIINKSEFLFINRRGKPFSPSTASRIVRNFSTKYLSKFSDFPSRNDDVEPFGSHLLRSLVATHFGKNGSIEEAAALLVDNSKVVKEHYFVDTIDHKLKRITKSITAKKLGIGE